MKILAAISTAVLVALGTLGISVYQSPCDSPVSYQIGSIDPRFNLTQSQLQSDIDQALNIWDGQYGKNLFVYDSKAKFKINLVFDERQGLSNQIGSLEENLQTQQNSMKPELAQYQQKLADFQKKVTDLNTQIDSWNSKGGAPKDEYDKLVAQQKDLKAQGDTLNQEAKKLNQSAYQFNSQVGSLNQTINTFNSTLVDKPEEGIFDPNADKIDIFFSTNHEELIHTLAHEYGHALGMNHVSNPNGIMYYRSNKDLNLTSEDKAELARVCKKLPVWEIWSDKAAAYVRENLRNWKLQTSKSS